MGELTGEAFARVESAIQNPAVRRRARHAVLENERTLRAVAALKQNDLARFGELMDESHVSLRDGEVAGKELDTLAELAWRQEGVLGWRMTGAGFGGCTVSIVRNDCLAAFQENVAKG